MEAQRCLGVGDGREHEVLNLALNPRRGAIFSIGKNRDRDLIVGKRSVVADESGRSAAVPPAPMTIRLGDLESQRVSGAGPAFEPHLGGERVE